MRYISIDTETSGLDPEKNKVLSIGAIIEDTTKKLPFEELPKFYSILLQREIVGSPRAITMNKDIIEMMGTFLEGSDENKKKLVESSGAKFLESDEVVKEFYHFLYENGLHDIKGLNLSHDYVEMKDNKVRPMITSNTKPITINVAGKNFGTFDKLFLQQLPWWSKLIKVRSRIIDPAILLCKWAEDESLPSLDECKKRSNIDGNVSHNALEDAWDVIQVSRNFY